MAFLRLPACQLPDDPPCRPLRLLVRARLLRARRFNPMLEYFNSVTVIFEMGNHGGVLPSYNFDTVRLYAPFDSQVRPGEYLWCLEFVVVCFYIYFFGAEVIKCKKNGFRQLTVRHLPAGPPCSASPLHPRRERADSWAWWSVVDVADGDVVASTQRGHVRVSVDLPPGEHRHPPHAVNRRSGQRHVLRLPRRRHAASYERLLPSCQRVP